MQNMCRLYGAVGKVGKGDQCKVYEKYVKIYPNTYKTYAKYMKKIYAKYMQIVMVHFAK